MKVVANSGTLSNVHVRNFGANGIAPLARYFAVQVECFPLSVYVPSFNYGPNAQPVWFIEDCEVSDFHSIRGGYCSAVMVTTKTNFLAGVYFTNRVAVVRRCQVRGHWQRDRLCHGELGGHQLSRQRGGGRRAGHEHRHRHRPDACAEH
ncbi:MAG: hypothetical protein M5U12_12215 [Verrucomicrobia bacterium]|nr:hypothetical protein [Verrucomicrobiota bacterium]